VWNRGPEGVKIFFLPINYPAKLYFRLSLAATMVWLGPDFSLQCQYVGLCASVFSKNKYFIIELFLFKCYSIVLTFILGVKEHFLLQLQDSLSIKFMVFYWWLDSEKESIWSRYLESEQTSACQDAFWHQRNNTKYKDANWAEYNPQLWNMNHSTKWRKNMFKFCY
jgi:hypothetical protein